MIAPSTSADVPKGSSLASPETPRCEEGPGRSHVTWIRSVLLIACGSHVWRSDAPEHA